MAAISQALIQQNLAARALTQLNKVAVFPQAAVVGYETGNFRRDDTVKVRRPKRRRAQNLNPRVAPGTLTEGEFLKGEVTLNRLWFDGFPVYGNEPDQSLADYIVETSDQMVDSIATPNDEYMYDQFRTWSIPASGAVALGIHAPVGVCVALDSSGAIADFDAATLRAGRTLLDSKEVPDGNRFAILSTTAKGAFLGDSVLVDGFAAALNIQSGQLIQTGVPNGRFVERYGFQVAGSTSVGGQAGVNLAGNAATLDVSAVADDTDFTWDDEGTLSTAQSCGAVKVTLDATGTTIGGSVGVGQIIRLGTTKADSIFGVILRIVTTTATAPVVSFIPYFANGRLAKASDITVGMAASIPDVPSVNVGHHREGLLMASRMIAEPSPGSGAVAASMRSRSTNLVIQVFSGAYSLTTVSEGRAYYMLCGAKFSDCRKGVLMLSL